MPVKNLTTTKFYSEHHAATNNHSLYTGTTEELLELVKANFEKGAQGYREGVVLVPVSPVNFLCPVVALKEGMKVGGTYLPRREGEEPVLSLYAKGIGKSPAKFVNIVLYSSELLAEDGDNTLPPEKGNFEVVTILADLRENPPQHFNSVVRNYRHNTGGTALTADPAETLEALVCSLEYWSSRVLSDPDLCG